MNKQKFDDLLAAYLENDLSDSQLAELHALVHGSDQLRIRFQQETRLHVLLRENSNEQVELNDLYRSTALPGSWKSKSVRERVLTAVVTIAALMLIPLVIASLISRADRDVSEQIGSCMSVSEGGGFSIKRKSECLRAKVDTPVEVGDQLICDANTNAMVRLNDGSILSVEPGAMLTLVSDQPEVSLQKGEVLFEIAPRDSDAEAFQVTTSQSTVAVMGTVFSLSENEHTELKVYEGSVTLTRHRDNTSVDVESQQMATTAEDVLGVKSLSRLMPSPVSEIITLTPTDDITLEKGKPVDSLRLMVEGDHRTCYLRFVVPDVGVIQAARIRLKQDIDTGKGTLSFFKGDHADWNEANLIDQNAPEPLSLVGQRAGVVRRGQTIEVDVSDAVQASGPVTIIMKLDNKNQNDIWFASRENEFPPQLILTYVPHSEPVSKSP